MNQNLLKRELLDKIGINAGHTKKNPKSNTKSYRKNRSNPSNIERAKINNAHSISK